MQISTLTLTEFSLLDQVPMGMCVLDRSGIVLFWNTCLETWTNIPRQEIVGCSLGDRFPHLRQPKYERRLRQTLDQGLTIVFSSQLHPHLIPCDGERGQLRYQHTTVTPLPRADGQGFNALLSIQDVTELTLQIFAYREMQAQAEAEIVERQRIEELLRRDRDLLNGITNTSVAAITVANLKGQIVYANTRAEEVLGFSKLKISDLTYNAPHWKITNFEGEPFPEEQLPFVQVVRTGQSVFDVRHAIEDPDGKRIYLSINGAPLRDRNGQLTSVVFCIADITQQYLAEKTRQESERLYRQMFEQNWTVKMLIDPASGAIVAVNPAASRFYGYSPEQLQQLKITDLTLLPPDHVHARMLRVQTERHGVFEFRHRLACGDIRSVSMHCNCVRLGGQDLLYTIIHDITERKQFLAALHHHRRRERLIESIAQHIRQTLNLNEILQTTVNEVQKFLHADRVLIHCFNASTQSVITIAEAKLPQIASFIGWDINYKLPPLTEYQNPYQPDRVQAIANIQQSDLPPEFVELLSSFAVKARLVIPILQEVRPDAVAVTVGSTSKRLWGFLVAHQCGTIRQWQLWEIELLQRLEDQVAVAIQQAELYQQVQQLNNDLERKVQERTAQLQNAYDYESTLKRITDQVRDSLDEDQILQTAVEALGTVLGAECCNTRLYNEDQTETRISHEYNVSLSTLLGSMTTTTDMLSIHRQLLQGTHFQFCTITPASIRQHQYRCTVIACPIWDDQGSLGDIWLFRRSYDAFHDLEVRLIRQVANQCAIALRQSRLYQNVQAQVQSLEQLNSLKDDFLSTISHELRTPLSSIKMSLQLMEIMLGQMGVLNTQQSDESVTSSLSAKVANCLQVVQEECDREINLVNDVLQLQQLEAGTQPLQLTPILLSDWIPQIVEAYEPQMQRQQQQLHIHLAADLPILVSDLFMLSRVLTELLTNATKFTPAGEHITVSAYMSSPDVLQMSLENTGVEIAPHEIDQIFNQFYRIPNNDPWKHPGTGMGLALVKKLVNYLGGSIWAESDDQRTRFILELPTQVHAL